VNWIKLFILGLLLALSPFQLKTEYYIFNYSLFGYGLMLIAYLFKKKDWKDWIIFAVTAGTIVLGLLNVFTVFYLFIFAFCIAVTVLYFIDSKVPVIANFSLGLIGVAAVLCGMTVSNALPIAWTGSIILNAPFFLCSSLLALFILDYQGLPNR
jgi:hypothetical protein